MECMCCNVSDKNANLSSCDLTDSDGDRYTILCDHCLLMITEEVEGHHVEHEAPPWEGFESVVKAADAALLPTDHELLALFGGAS